MDVLSALWHAICSSLNSLNCKITVYISVQINVIFAVYHEQLNTEVAFKSANFIQESFSLICRFAV